MYMYGRVGAWESPPSILKVNNQCNEIQIRCKLHWLIMDHASSLLLPWDSSFRDGGPGIGRDFIQLVQTDYR